MKFNHCPPILLKDLKTKNIDGKRYYLTPNGNYPSITTLLGSFNKKWIMEWRERVGEEEANRISVAASSRGTKVHSLCEKYLLNEEITNKSSFPHIMETFYSIRPLLNEINNIHYLECALYSDKLKVGGRCDCIGEFSGKLSIIDFKTSKKLKKEEDIEDYFLQTAVYGMCYYELTGIKIKQIVIIIAVDHEEPQIFIKPISDYILPAILKIREYYKSYIH